MTAPRKPRKVGPKFMYQIVDGNEVRWQFFEIDVEDLAKIDPSAYAVTVASKSMVVVERGISDDIRDISAFHEMMHFCSSAPGDSESLSRILGCESDKVEALEEGFVSFLAPKLYALLVKNGMLIMPKPEKK